MVGIGGGGRGVANTRDAIVAAARREFLSKGFHEASLRSIASEAGVTTGAIYGYFSSKEALLGAAVGNVGEGLCELCQRAFVEFESRSMEATAASRRGRVRIPALLASANLPVCARVGRQAELLGASVAAA